MCERLWYSHCGLTGADLTASSGIITDSNNQGATFNITSYSVAAVPEPATYAAGLGLLALGLIAGRRLRTA